MKVLIVKEGMSCDVLPVAMFAYCQLCWAGRADDGATIGGGSEKGVRALREAGLGFGYIGATKMVKIEVFATWLPGEGISLTGTQFDWHSASGSFVRIWRQISWNAGNQNGKGVCWQRGELKGENIHRNQPREISGNLWELFLGDFWIAHKEVLSHIFK